MEKYRGYHLDIIYSEDDAGWYCEVVNQHGTTVFQSDIMIDEYSARKQGRRWVNEEYLINN